MVMPKIWKKKQFSKKIIIYITNEEMIVNLNSKELEKIQLLFRFIINNGFGNLENIITSKSFSYWERKKQREVLRNHWWIIYKRKAIKSKNCEFSDYWARKIMHSDLSMHSIQIITMYSVYQK